MAGRGRGNYMPLCQCGKILTDVRSADEQTRWAERLDVSWGCRENGTAYWFYCQPCHQKVWPHDRRVIGRYSRPAPKYLAIYLPKAAAYGKSRLASGDYFFLTSAFPEWVSDESGGESRRVFPERASDESGGESRRVCARFAAPLAVSAAAVAAVVVAASNYCSGRSGR
jgi:hypothetical protein